MDFKDVNDALRALRWRLRQVYYRCRHRLGYARGIEAWRSDPESCESTFELIMIGVANCAPPDLPARITVTPENILDFSEALQSAGFHVQPSTQADVAEVWRRFSKYAMHMAGGADAQVSSRRHKCMLRIGVASRDPRQVVFRIEAGEFIPHPEHVEARLGMEPGTYVNVTGAELGQLLSAMSVHGRPAPANDDESDRSTTDRR